MSTYFYALLVASVCGAVCTVVAWGGFEKYIKYISSLVCVLLMIAPLKDIDFSELFERAENNISFETEEQSALLYKTASELTEERAEGYISEIVFNEFGIKPIYTDINIDWEQTEPIINDITVALSKENIDMASETEAYLMNVLGGEVIVIEA